MKVEELNPNPAVSALTVVRTDKPEPSVVQGEVGAKQQKGADKVELSSYMPKVATSQRRLDFRAERVEELKAQVQAGTYDVSGKSVAEKMLSKIVTTSLK